MIEKYFKKGIRFKWTKPKDSVGGGPMDGSVVDSRQAATRMIYDGMDGEVITSLNANDVRALGLSMGRPIQYAWLDYNPGRTSRLPLGPYDALTGYMSGCIIVYWNEKGVRYAGHIGTLDASGEINRKVKRTFSFAMNKTTKGFNPAGAWNPGEIKAIDTKRSARIFGLVTTGGDFYSVLMFYIPNNEWCVGGIKKVQPISHDTLKLRLLR